MPVLQLVDAQAAAIIMAVIAVAVWQRLWPRSVAASRGGQRLRTNVSLYAINVLVCSVPSVHLAGRLLDAGFIAESADLAGLGSCAAALWWFTAIDLSAYLLHRLFHRVPLLYRIHCAHHSDCDVDLTTAFRRHPVEFALNAGSACAVGLLLGAPLAVVAAYGTAATILQIWQHGNVGLPPRADSLIRLILVTPAMHRTHHALEPPGYTSNYGSVLSIWDRAFATEFVGDEPPRFGVSGLEASSHQRLDMVLLSPLLLDRRTDAGQASR